MTDRPFGVNLTILPTINPVPYDEYRDVIIAGGVAVVETAGNNPAPHLPALHAAGIKVVHKAVSVRHAVKAEQLGVDAINMGTRFVATVEAPVHQRVKEQIVANDERATDLVFRPFRNTARVARNAISQEIRELEDRPGAEFADIAHLASGARGRHEVLHEGDLDGGLWWAGQAQGLVHDIPTCIALVTRIIADAEEIIATRLGSLLS